MTAPLSSSATRSRPSGSGGRSSMPWCFRSISSAAEYCHAPPEPVLGLATGETRGRSMTALEMARAQPALRRPDL